MILWQPRSRWPYQVRKLGWNGIENGRRDGNSVDPDIPCRQKTSKLAKSPVHPHVQATFERHPAVQSDHRSGHRQIKQQHRRDPCDRLRSPQPRSHADPRTADNAEDLGQNKVAQTELAAQVMFSVRRGGDRIHCS